MSESEIKVMKEKTPPKPDDPSSFFCPYCGNDRPSYAFAPTAPTESALGTLQWMTIVCHGELPGRDSEGGVRRCRRILGVQVMGWLPPGVQLPAALEGLAADFRRNLERKH